MDKINFYDGQKYMATELLRVPEYYNKNEIAGQYDVIRRSITEIGVKSPLVVNDNPERNNIIIHGVQVYKIAKELGIDELPVWYVNCSEDEEKILRVSLDKRGTAQLSNEDIISLIGNLSYENFFEPEVYDSLIIQDQFAETLIGTNTSLSQEKRAIKQIMLRLSNSQKELYEKIGRDLGMKNQTEVLLMLMDFYIKNTTND